MILITGGTGFIGQPLGKTLADLGAQVFVLTRRRSFRDAVGVRHISSLSQLPSAGCDIIINLAGEPIAQRWSPAAKAEIRKSRIGTTAALVDYIATAARKPALLISGSAIGYYGTDPVTAFGENTPPSSGAPFSRALCAEWETVAQQAQRHGVRTVLLRIGAVLEKDGGMLSRLLPPFRLGLGGPIGDGSQWLSWIDRDDLIALILHIIATPDITGAINATAPAPVSNLDFSRTLAAVLRRPCLVRTPAFVLRAAFGEMADEIMLSGQKVLPAKAVANGFSFRYPTLEQSLRKIFGKQGGV